MNTSIADLPHPSWCAEDIPAEHGIVHLSNDRQVPATAGGAAESGFIHVSVERVDADGRPGAPALRIEGGGDPMTPLQAFELAATIQAAAVAALMGDGAL